MDQLVKVHTAGEDGRECARRNGDMKFAKDIRDVTCGCCLREISIYDACDEKIAKNIVDKILLDISDRKGIKHEYNNIDEDILEEIKTTWKKIITDELSL